MLKQISISDLMVDMYVADIVETPNCKMPKRRKGMIRDPRIINKFIEVGVEKVVIDTQKGLDVSAVESANDDNASLFESELEHQIEQFSNNLSSEYHELSLEWGCAKEIFHTSTKIVLKTVEVVQNDGAVNPHYFEEAARAISRSIMRNRDALTWLGKLRNQDSYLYEHSVNTATLMGIFARESGLSIEQTEACITGALLHDLGQSKIEEELFERTGPLTEQEFEEIKKHVEFGESLLPEEGTTASRITRSIISEHHERCDGSGYPKGLKGDEISRFGRMFAIVDTYDALTNNRSYKDAVPSSQGMKTLLELSKTKYDEVLVHQFIKCMGIYPTGSLARLDNGMLVVVIAQNPSAPLKPLVKVIYNATSEAYVQPQMMDLSRTDCSVKILSYENPKKYGINVDEFMPQELLES